MIANINKSRERAKESMEKRQNGQTKSAPQANAYGATSFYPEKMNASCKFASFRVPQAS
jgi:hypothetical protein